MLLHADGVAPGATSRHAGVGSLSVLKGGQALYIVHAAAAAHTLCSQADTALHLLLLCLLCAAVRHQRRLPALLSCGLQRVCGCRGGCEECSCFLQLL